MSDPVTSSPSFTQAFQDGLLDEFYDLPYGSFYQALAIKREVNRERLVAGLTRYARNHAAPEAVFTSLELLSHPNAYTVTTGQQIGLLLGPLYTLSKAISAIKLARQLSSEARPVVPVFWLATQDHDALEIKDAHLIDMQSILHTLSQPYPEGVPSGRVVLESAWVDEIINALSALDYPQYARDEVITLLKESAARSQTIADWFAHILFALLGGQGLVIIDPLQGDIAPLFSQVIERELRSPLPSSKSINTQGEALQAQGFAPQLGRGEGATNLFVEEDDGQRRLLRMEGAHYVTDVRSYTLDDLLTLYAQDASRITPAAGLRPITQDAALPNAVTVVGPGELRYFAQLRGVYAQHGIAMSLTHPRAAMTVLEPPIKRILGRYALRAADIQADAEGICERLALELSGHAEAFQEKHQALKALMEGLSQEVNDLDPTLVRSVARAERHLHRTFEALEKKGAAALARRDQVLTAQFARLQAHLLPAGHLQERYISSFSFFLKFGIQSVMQRLLDLPAEGDVEISI